MKKLIWIIVLTLSALVSYSQSISMQSTNAGFSIALDGGHYTWESEEFGVATESGKSFKLQAAYGMTENIEVVAGFQSAFINPAEPTFMPFSINHYKVGGRYTFGSTMRRIRGQVGVAVFGLASVQGVQDDWSGFSSEFNLRGFGSSLSGGCKYHLSLPLAMTFSAGFSSGKFSTTGDGAQQNFDYSSYQFSIGMVMYINQL